MKNTNNFLIIFNYLHLRHVVIFYFNKLESPLPLRFLSSLVEISWSDSGEEVEHVNIYGQNDAGEKVIRKAHFRFHFMNFLILNFSLLFNDLNYLCSFVYSKIDTKHVR